MLSSLRRDGPGQTLVGAGFSAALLVGGCGADITIVTGERFEARPPPSPVAASGVAGPVDAGGSQPVDSGLIRGECGLIRAPAYAFPSRFVAGESSVDYSAPVARHVLMAELGHFIGGLTASIDQGARYAPGELVAALELFVQNPERDLDAAPLSVQLVGAPALAEASHADVSAEVDLITKLAGNDPSTEHAAWADPGVFKGWSDTSVGRGQSTPFTPQGLLRALCERIEINAINRSNGLLQRDPALRLLPVHVTRNGRDLRQLILSLLEVAVAFSQAADALLDADVEGQGLLASPEREGGQRYSALEHAWDAAFGYFGAARDYDRYGHAEVALENAESAVAGGWRDSNADCRISLKSEVNFGASLYAAARDRDAAAATDFRGDAFDAFVEGRRLIGAAPLGLSAAEVDALSALRDQALEAWEKSLAATVVHSLNRLSAQIDAALASAAQYSFGEQARRWSELKGLALGFQFNPRSGIAPLDFARFHELVGDAPVVPDTLPPTNVAELSAYRAGLESARAILQASYAFDPGNMAAW
jgi:hypothetical protein